MIVRDDSLFTVLSDQDLHDHSFEVFHYKGNDHIDVSIPLNRHEFRTMHLARSQCAALGQRLHHFAKYSTLMLPESASPPEYHI